MVILAKLKGSTSKTFTKIREENVPEGMKVKVILQIELQKIAIEIVEGLNQISVKTEKRNFLLEVESPKEATEWLSQFGEKQRVISSLKT